MSDQHPERGAHDFDGPVSDLLSGLEPPAHGPKFWRALDARIDLVTALRDAETPEHLHGFWPSFDAALRAEPERQLETGEDVTLRTTVFDDALPAAKRARRRRPGQPWSRRRLETLVQLSAAAAVLALIAGGLAWWGTRDPNDAIVAGGPEITRATTTTAAGPTTTAPAPLFGGESRVDEGQTAPLARGSVPVGASPDGKYLYMAAPAQSTERCTFGPTSALSSAAMWLYAQPVDGSSPSRRILTDRVFAEPKMVAGPNEKVVVSDSCNGPTTHVIASAEQNGALSTDRVITSPPATPLAVAGAAWSASGTGLYLRAEGAAGWFRYDVASGEAAPAPEISPAAQVVEQLANDQLVSVARRSGSPSWAVSVGKDEIIAISAPSHDDFTRAVRVDTRHGQLAIAGKDELVVLTARSGGEVEMNRYDYKAEAVTWAADGNGLVAAPLTGGLDYLTFVPSATNALSTVSLGYKGGVAYDLLSVPASSTLVIRQAVPDGQTNVAGEAYLLKLTT